MSVDVHTLLGDSDESSQRPRRSDFTCYNTLNPPDDFSFPVYPYGSFYYGESSGADEGSFSEFFETPSYVSATLDLVPTGFSFFPECTQTDTAGPSSVPAGYSSDSASPSAVPGGADDTSKIFCHIPLLPDSRSASRCNHAREILRDLICSIDPGSPESWDRFTSYADQSLSLLASLGMDSSELVGWEMLCRDAEVFVRRLRSFATLRPGTTPQN
ncbi:uncharacterized protein LOC110105091 [Dendrobium catenatum]|uniref:uncharacterized protein LOC110105091 n=1 Tax=Dendrobium catenatum TaxID=906689 RepID=UPI0010A01BBB|nr:uncharacterized protein LOC110105091 [Dendrobium catenatum]